MIEAHHELPPDKAVLHRKAVLLEWLTIAYLITAICLLAVVLGGSQAMKAAWYEDLLSLLPPLAFLVASRFRHRVPTREFPYGYHRSISIGFLIASAALLAMGLFILYDSVSMLVSRERPSIGLVELFGQQIWLGWLMIAALVYSAVPAVLLGRAKIPLAEQLHDKVLYADAKMNRADWLTAGAAIVGVLGIGAGIWWADAVAAIVIGLDVSRDGAGNVRRAVADLMDQRPTTVDSEQPLSILDELRRYVDAQPWVQQSDVRLREEGHVLTGEIYVVPDSPRTDLPELVRELTEQALDVDWRLHDLAVVVQSELGALDEHGHESAHNEAQGGAQNAPRSRSRQGRPSGSRNPR
jgi:cation diffusion facilitator family transporter